MNSSELTGQTRTHITALAEPACELHVRVLQPFLRLRAAASEAGLDLVPASSFRSFERQLRIWNGKFRGERPMLDEHGNAIDSHALSPAERIGKILLWSALPGASRHHWGSDLDLIDRSAVEPGYRVQLVAAEFEAGGPFARLADWLERNASDYGFFRPFRGVDSGVAAEPWHYSFAPVAESARLALTAEVLEESLAAHEIDGKAEILEQLGALHERFVIAIDAPPAAIDLDRSYA